MNAHFTNQFQILEIKGIYSPNHYQSSDQDPADRSISTQFTFWDRPYMGDSTWRGDSKPGILLKAIQHSTVGIFNFVQIINLSFTFLNNFQHTFSIVVRQLD